MDRYTNREQKGAGSVGRSMRGAVVPLAAQEHRSGDPLANLREHAQTRDIR